MAVGLLIDPSPSPPAPVPAKDGSLVETRIPALDGLRGLMTIFVVVSHYFGEVRHGPDGFKVGWIAVEMFFVLSGFLIGRLILEKKHHANFFAVFYVRRICRTFPVYFACVTIVFGLLAAFSGATWIDAPTRFPLWAYLSFTQNGFMLATGSIGAHWLAPTWTLAVEEQFYLLVPAVFFVVPRRWLLPVLTTIGLSSIAFRFLVYAGGLPEMAALVLLPGLADVLVAGLIAAVLHKTPGIRWERYDRALRVASLLLLASAAIFKVADGRDGLLFPVFGSALIAAGCAAFILALVRGAPEARRLHSPFLRFFGTTSYSVYLTHLAVLGLLHGLILGTAPDVATLPQIAVTLAALPLCAGVAWAMTKIAEEPLTAYGRTWRWGQSRAVPRPQPEPTALAS